MTHHQERALGFWRCWSLVVGGAIGSAVFMLPAVMAPYGGIGLLSLAAATAGATSIAMMFGNLARRVTGSGGVYAYARAGFGDAAGFAIAWSMWISIWVSCAAIAIAFSAYAGALLPVSGASNASGAGIGLVVVWVAVAINCAGIRESGIASLVLTLLKITPLIVVSLAGLRFVDLDAMPAATATASTPLALFGSAFALAFWNFVGIECATVPSENVVSPERTIPRATLIGTLTVGAIYLVIALVGLTVMPQTEVASSSAPLADLARKLFGGVGGTIVILGALVSTGGCLLVSILEAGQTTMAAARDGLFPRSLATLSSRQVPTMSYLLAGGLASGLMLLNFSKGLVGAFTFAALLATLTAVIPYAVSAAAGVVLAKRAPAGRWEMPVGVIAFGICLWVIATSGVAAVFWSLVLFAAGLPVYFGMRRIRVAPIRTNPAVSVPK